ENRDVWPVALLLRPTRSIQRRPESPESTGDHFHRLSHVGQYARAKPWQNRAEHLYGGKNCVARRYRAARHFLFHGDRAACELHRFLAQWSAPSFQWTPGAALPSLRPKCEIQGAICRFRSPSARDWWSCSISWLTWHIFAYCPSPAIRTAPQFSRAALNIRPTGASRRRSRA